MLQTVTRATRQSQHAPADTATVVVPAEVEPGGAGRIRKNWWRSPAFWLPVLVALAGGLRFWKLESPGIWGDEAATYGRVNGSYVELLEVLQFDGFMPLHYQLYWLLARVLVLEPWWMRFWPALTGLLTVPAVYLLARQLMGRPASWLASLLAATSAYLLYYSRDAKMYAPLWLFVTLSTACFLAWAGSSHTGDPTRRLSRRLWFWGWVGASMAAVGIHAPALLITAVQPLMLPAMTARASTPLRAKLLPLTLGLALIVAGPAVHYGYFNRWHEQIRQFGWGASMLQWVEWYNRGRDLPQLVRFTATAYAVGWEWPDRPQERDLVDPQWMRRFEWLCIALGVGLLLGVLPWRRLGRWCRIGRGRAPPAGESSPPGDQRHPDSISWPGVWVVAVWAIVPAYGVYCVSVSSPAPPWAIFGFLASNPWLVLITGLASVGALLSMRRWQEIGIALLLILLLLALGIAIYAGVWIHRHYTTDLATWSIIERGREKPPNMLWMPRYLGVMYPAVLLAAAALLIRLPVGLRELVVVGVVLVNLANFAVKVVTDPEPPVGQIIAELWEDRRAAERGAVRRLTFLQSPFGPGFEPGTGTISGPVGRYYYSLRLPVPLSPPEFREDWRVVERGLAVNTDLRPRAVAERVQRAGPTLERVVLWERGDARATAGRDPLRNVLGSEWTLVQTDTFNTFDHWTWRRLAQIRRFEYVRNVAGSGATRPAVPGSSETTTQRQNR